MQNARHPTRSGIKIKYAPTKQQESSQRVPVTFLPPATDRNISQEQEQQRRRSLVEAKPEVLP